MSTDSVNVITVPAFSDNYLWLFHKAGDTAAYVVDPGDAKPVIAALEQHQLQLAGILITHHHPDHTGGINALLDYRKVPVYGPSGASVPQVDHPLQHGDDLILDNGLAFQIFEVPGHTLDHIAYFSPEAELLFCGDTLFAGGCGRLFEGTAQQMYHSLQSLAQLPGNTKVYCAHEYTLANLKFAQAVEADNADLQQRVEHDSETRARQQPTVPSTMALEKATNPFLRSHIPAVKTAAEAYCGEVLERPEDVLAAVRRWKDHF